LERGRPFFGPSVLGGPYSCGGRWPCLRVSHPLGPGGSPRRVSGVRIVRPSAVASATVGGRGHRAAGEPACRATSPSPMVSTSACRVRSPLLAGSRLIPPMEGTKMFQFPSVCGAAPGFHTVRPRRPSDGGHTAAAVLSGAPAGARRPSLDFYPQGILVQRPPATRPREGGPAGHRASTEAYRMVSRPGYLRA